MRCQNCGWSNPEGATVCEKCKQPLSATQSNPTYQSQTQPENLRKTVRESTPVGVHSEPYVSMKDGCCPKCGYPVAPGSDACPSCGTGITSTTASAQEKPLKRNATINPWSRRDNFCTLTPIDWNGRIINLEKPIEEFEEEVVLTRDNTMPSNKTITSQEQALLKFQDGHWTIIDKSDQHTTFVLANREMEVHNGDIIMLGNQLFRFNDGNAK